MNDDPASRPPQPEGAGSDHSIFRALRDLVRWLSKPGNGEESVREALEELIEEKADSETAIENEERTLLFNILDLRGQTVADVMVPRADIVAIDVAASIDDLVELINREGHSRIPVFQENLDESIGMVHIKDVLAAGDASKNKHGEAPGGEPDEAGEKSGGPRNLRSILRDVLFVSPSMQVLELLLEMRVKRTHMALVVDEFGGVDGLLTIEDLVEEIVGEIEDEHDDEDEPALNRRDDGSLDADARVSIESFEELVGRILSEEEREENDTLGGLVFSLAGRVPIRGELIKHPTGMEIEVLDADPRRVKRLKLRGIAVSEQL